MPTLVLSDHQCDLVIEALMCLRTGRLERDNHFEADELQKMADYVWAVADQPSLPRPAPSPGRSLE